MDKQSFREGVARAEDALRRLFPATPLQRNEHLSKQFGAKIYLKREDLSLIHI